MKMICGMKEARRGKFSPTGASSKKRRGNYMLNGSMPPRLVHILLNKLMFGSILFPQNEGNRDAETIFRVIIMQGMC